MIVNKLQIFAGLVALSLGIIVYSLRNPADIYLFSTYLPTIRTTPYDSTFVVFLLNILPGFFHVFAFALLTSGLISTNSRKYQFCICCGWLFLEFFFEAGQYYKETYLKLIPSWFDNIPVLQCTKNFFLNGIFDIYDITAIVAGSSCAFCFLIITSNKRNKEWYQVIKTNSQ